MNEVFPAMSCNIHRSRIHRTFVAISGFGALRRQDVVNFMV